MLSSITKRLAVVSSVLVIAFGMIAPAAAQQGNSGGSGLSISPTRYDLQVNPGESQDIKITLKNISGTSIVAKSFINDFTSDNATGQPQIITNTSVFSPQSIRNFQSGLADVPLAKDASMTETINFSVPKSAAPGAYYGIIRYAAVRGDLSTSAGNDVSLTASVGVVVLLTVPGNIKEQIQVNRVAVYKDTVTNNSSSFYISQPGAVGIDVKNLGNGFAQPFGNVTVSNMFGKQDYSYQLNSSTPRGVVLPNASRTFKDSIHNIKIPGRYTVTANVSYGNGGEVLISTTHFWYLPVWLIVLLVIILAVLIAVGYILYRRLSRRPAKLRRK